METGGITCPGQRVELEFERKLAQFHSQFFQMLYSPSPQNHPERPFGNKEVCGNSLHHNLSQLSLRNTSASKGRGQNSMNYSAQIISPIIETMQ